MPNLMECFGSIALLDLATIKATRNVASGALFKSTAKAAGHLSVAALSLTSYGCGNLQNDYRTRLQPRRTHRRLSAVQGFRTRKSSRKTDGIAIWLNKDPIAEQGGINLYEFVGNDPNDGMDVLGLQGEGAAALIALRDSLNRVNSNYSFCDCVKKIPLLGGMLGGASDITFGTFKTAFGVVTLGQSGTLKDGAKQIGAGAGSLAQIAYSDALGTALVVPGKVTMTGMDVFNVITLGKLSLPDKTYPSGHAPPTGILSALFKTLKDAPIPAYGFYLGPNWGTPQLGTSGSPCPLNQVDYYSYVHDKYGGDRSWVLNNLFPPSPNMVPDGPVAAAIVLYGAIPFWLNNGQ